MKLKGYLLGAAAAVSYGMNPAFTLPLYADGMNPESVMVLRYGFAIPLIALMMFLFKRPFRVERNSVPSLVGLGFIMATSSLTLFISYKYMAVGIASTILFVYPIFVAIIMTLLFRERISLLTTLCLLVSTFGIYLLYNTGNGTTLSLVGTLFVIASSVSYAVYLVWVGKGSAARMSNLTLNFYVIVFGTMLLLAVLLLSGKSFTLPTKWYLWLDAFALALFPTAISLLCTKGAIQIIGSTPTAILGALEPVTAVVIGMVMFNEGMTFREAVGIILILVAVTFVVTRGNSRRTTLG